MQTRSKPQKRGTARAAKGRAGLSAQQTIPYIAMHPDGVCQLPGGIYTKTVEYEDINYSVASTEDQTAIFGGWSSFLNYFDSSLPFQLSFINRRSRDRSRYKVNIPPAEDDFNSVREEFTSMLKNQIAKSNNGIERTKYITFGLPAEGVAELLPVFRIGHPSGRAADVKGGETAHGHILLHWEIRQIFFDHFVQLFKPSHSPLLKYASSFPAVQRR